MHVPGIIGSADPAKTASEITGLKLARFNRGKVSSKAAGTTPNGMLALLAGIEDEVIMSPTPPANALAVVDLQATPLTTYENSKAVGRPRENFALEIRLPRQPGHECGLCESHGKVGGLLGHVPARRCRVRQPALPDDPRDLPGPQVPASKAPAKVTDLTSGEIVSER